MRASAFVYPWDVVGDPEAPRRLAGLGIEQVTLASAYHSTRALTPRHPQHRIVTAPHSAVLYPPSAKRWAGLELRPYRQSWMAAADPWAEAADALAGAGLEVHTWVVLAHNSRLGAEHPGSCVRNAYGDRYPWAPCIARPEVLARLRYAIWRHWPDVVIAGSRDGYFAEEESSAVAADIVKSRADLLFIGMTTPKKEIFLGRYGALLGVPVMHGVGGSFDVLAGVTRRAPRLWQRLGLEWAYRVLQEPRRLWRRYLTTNVAFVGMSAAELFHPRPPYPRPHAAVLPTTKEHTWAPRSTGA